MVFELRKLGYVLMSRRDGKKALAAFLPSLAGVGENEEVVVDFDGVNTFSPSWGDEFLTPLADRFGSCLSLKNAANPSVAMTIETQESVTGRKYKIL